MKKFDRFDESDSQKNPAASERLREFTKAMWNSLVPSSGPCASLQGELVRANERLQSEYLRNGMGNYFVRDEPQESLADNHYGQLVLLVLDTMIANRNQALVEDDVAYFAEVRRQIEPQWLVGLRSDKLFNKSEEEELSAAEKEELAQLDAQPRGPAWDDLFARLERCIANWCLTNTVLIDRAANPVTERGISDVTHIFAPPPPPPKCRICHGKGWIVPTNPGDFPSFCACKK